MQPPDNSNKPSIELDSDISASSEAHLAGVSDEQFEAYRKKVLSCFNQSASSPENPTSQGDLARILAEHKRWIKSVLDPNSAIAGKRAILRGASLRGAKLADTDFRGADLRSTDLSGADLQRCNFSMADLSHSNLTGALMMGAVLTGALIVGTDLSTVELNDVVR